MNATRRLHVLLLALSAIGLTFRANATVGVRVIIENRAPDNGTWLTPVWVGFHDGSFDPFGLNLPASEALERLAEDGNIVPMSEAFAASGKGTLDGVIPADMGLPQIGPGETATMTFVLDNYDYRNTHMSFLTMVIPSNDAFVGNDDPQAHRLFDGYGNFLGGYFTIHGSDVLDAGTEVNDEVPEHTAFFGQTEPDSGDDEYGVVHPHPGYLPPGSGGILDDPIFADADFTQPGYEIARVIIVRSDTVVPSGAVSGTWDYDGSPYLVQGDIVVPFGETLTIEPGVQVVFLCDCRMVVEGSLQAIGTEEAPILFTKDRAISEWHGLHFFHASEPSYLSHCIVEYADADGSEPDNLGGGIYGESSALTIDHSVIRYNDAYYGGGVYCDDCDLVVRYSQIVDNSAVRGGAGIQCDNSRPVIYANEIARNGVASYSGSGSGGGLYMRWSDTLILNNNISDNQVYLEDFYDPAHGRGGGVAAYGESLVTLIGNRITDNLVHAAYEYGSSAKGGAVWCDTADAVLINNTISGNTAEALPEWNEEHGGGVYIYSYSGYLTIANTIMWGDLPQEISAPSEYGAADITVSYSDIQGGEDGVEITPNNHLYWLEGNLDTDPLFGDPGNGDLRLASGSPCIDAADSTAVPPDTADLDEDGDTSERTPVDLDGNSRFVDDPETGDTGLDDPPDYPEVVDVGAYEFQVDIPGDLDGDGCVDQADLGILLADWDCAGGSCPGDADGDGDTDQADLGILLAHWGEGCP